MKYLHLLNRCFIASLTLSAALLTACSEDRDSNPVLDESATTFKLNVPANATNNVYDLANATTVDITCSQPDYGGFPLSTTYAVQVSLDPTFTDAGEGTPGNYQVLPTTFTTTRIGVLADELNECLLALWGGKPENAGVAFPTTPIPVYIRLRANITGQTNRGVCLSNIVELPNVLGTAAAAVKMPTELWLTGSMNGNEFTKAAKVNSWDGQFWSVVYFAADDNFKLSAKEGSAISVAPTIDEPGTSGATVEEDGTGGYQVKVATAGWYIVYVKMAIVSNDYAPTIGFYPPNIYVFGAANGGTWGYDDAWKFSVPTDGTGSFVSPPLTAAGEVRMCVQVAPIDSGSWWRAEFTLHGTTIFYREDANIVDNWAKDLGSDYSITGAPGMVISLDFTNGTGSAK
jgi:hypothetical protein